MKCLDHDQTFARDVLKSLILPDQIYEWPSYRQSPIAGAFTTKDFHIFYEHNVRKCMYENRNIENKLFFSPVKLSLTRHVPPTLS